MNKTPLIPDLMERLVNITYQVDKILYPLTVDRRAGWVKAGYIVAYGLEFGYGRTKIAAQLEKAIGEAKQELSDLCAKVEA